MPPRRRAPIAEDTPRLDVRRLVLDLSAAGIERAAGSLRLRYGVLLRYRIDKRQAVLHLQVGDMPRWRYAVLASRSVRCNTCGQATEILYWLPQSADASAGEGRCGACCGVRWLSGYLTGARGHTGRLQPELRREVRAGNQAGVVRCMARGPREWLAGRQALEDEGLAPRRYTLEDGNKRRWCWQKKK